MNAQKYMTLAAVGLGLGAVAYIAVRGVKGIARDTTKAAVNVTTGVFQGAVAGIGEAVGIPDTDAAKCAAAQAAGDSWDASFYCPIGTWFGTLFEAKK